jgi:short-subunit dehydrogenase
VQDNNCGTLLANALNGTKVDVLINNAGYFFGPVETIKSLNFDEEIKMIDICAIGPLRITSGLFNAGLLARGAKVNHTMFSFVAFAYLLDIGCDDIISRRQRCLEKSSESAWSRLWPSYV